MSREKEYSREWFENARGFRVCREMNSIERKGLCLGMAGNATDIEAHAQTIPDRFLADFRKGVEVGQAMVRNGHKHIGSE